ncbi:MAG: T9SS type A sorting domain-containing protein [bacterium]
MPVPLMNSLLPTTIDNDGNIVTAIDPYSSTYGNNCFIKYDQNGNKLSYKSYSISQTSYPVSIVQTTNGYSMFCAISASYMKTGFLPMIFKTNSDGDSLAVSIPYDIKNESLYDSLSLEVNTANNKIGTLELDGNYYNASIQEKVKPSNHGEINQHCLVLSSYNSDGKLLWRKGVDTLVASDYYAIMEIKLLKSKNFILLTRKQINSEHKIQIIEFDLNGNVIKKIDPQLLDKSFFPLSIEKLANNDYVVLGNRLVKDTTTNKLIRLNSNGEYIESLGFPKRNLGVGCDFIKQSPSGNLVLVGSTALQECDSNTCTNKQKIMMFCFDQDFNYISELEYGEHRDDDPTDIRNIYFFDNDNFIAIGYKSRYKFYIAKFSLSASKVKDESTLQSNLMVSPNPAGDFITITFKLSVGSAIQIYNTLGEIVMSAEARHAVPLRINISNLPKGMYFVRIDGETAKFIKN